MSEVGRIPAQESASIPTEQAADVRSSRAQAMFPGEWEKMLTLTGKPRSRLRARLKNQADYLHGMSLLPADARCGNCKNLITARLSRPLPACDLDSDFHGYALVKLAGRCPRWVAAQPASPTPRYAEGVNQEPSK